MANQITITEALAEIKTIKQRLQKKREFLAENASRLSALRDPLEKRGGSEKVVAEEIQSYNDLVERVLALRLAIGKANSATDLTIEGVTRTIEAWLVWRRECAREREQMMTALSSRIQRIRNEAAGKEYGSDSEPLEALAHVDERKLQEDLDKHIEILGKLDGLLSLRNATTTIDAYL